MKYYNEFLIQFLNTIFFPIITNLLYDLVFQGKRIVLKFNKKKKLKDKNICKK